MLKLENGFFNRVARDIGIGNLKAVKQVVPSYRNQSFLLQGEFGFMLARLHQDIKTQSDVAWEHAVGEHARLNGIRTPALLHTQRKSDEHYSFYEWLPGRALSAQPLTVELCQSAGNVLSNVHNALASFDSAVKFTESIESRACQQLAADTTSLNDLELVAKNAKWSKKIIKKVQMYASLVESHKSLAKSNHQSHSMPSQCLHGDYNARNIVIGGRIWAVLDWEDAFWGDPCLDIARALVFLCGFPVNPHYREHTLAFLQGYSKNRKLTANQINTIIEIACHDTPYDWNWLLLCLVSKNKCRIKFLKKDIVRMKMLLKTQMQDDISRYQEFLAKKF
jgi:Ser/Thr protein kinase RdoA (MazF antagonist)